jgi:hypothetical protein
MDDDQTEMHPRIAGRRRNGQFPKGVSGNPKGRPRKARSTKAIIQDMLASKVLMTVEGRPKLLSVTEAMAARVKVEALTGSLRGLERGVAIAERYSFEDPDPPELGLVDISMLSREERKLFLELLRKVMGDSPNDDLRSVSTGYAAALRPVVPSEDVDGDTE